MTDVEVVEEEGGLRSDLDLFSMTRLPKEYPIGSITHLRFLRWKISLRYFKVKKMMEITIVAGEGGVFHLDDETNTETSGVLLIYLEREIKMF